MYIGQFDNLLHLVLPVHYASSCHAAFSRIQSVVIVLIVLSQVVLCLKPTVEYIFNSLTILLELILNCINHKYSDTKTQVHLTNQFGKILMFSHQICDFKVILMPCAN